MNGVYVGRFSPLHKGHMSVIDIMQEECTDCMLLIGSSASTRTIKTPFNYFERKTFIKSIYPDICLQGIPDVIGDDAIWISMLDDICNCTFGTTDVTFYGGSEADVSFFYDYGKKVKIIDRSIIPISATAIRQLMMLGQDITPFVSDKIAKRVVSHFQEIMKEEW